MSKKHQTGSVTKHEFVTISFFYFIIFYIMVFQGAYYVTGLLMLNITLLFYIIGNKKHIKLDITLISFIALFLMAVLSNVFLSINAYIGACELVKYMLFPLSYAVFCCIEEKEKLNDIFYRSFVLLMIFGILAWLGFSLMPGMVTLKGNRLQSFLQYANTTALFMGIGLLLSIDKYISHKQKRSIILGLLFTVALFLTQSRTTFVIFLLVLVIFLFNYFNKRARLIFISTLGISLFALALSGARIARIALTEPTLIERIITFHDAVLILFRKPFGLGLGNWQFMQFKYQSAPYQVRYIHNTILNISLDVGILAGILFGAILLGYFIKNFKSKSIHFYIFLLILLQSFFEVSFNYGIVILYFTYLLTRLEQPEYLKISVLTQLKLPSQLKYLLVVPLILAIVFFISESYVSKGNRETNRNQIEALNSYVKAQKLNPLNSELYFKMAKIEKRPEKSLVLLEQGYQQNPYHFQVILSLAEGYVYSGNMEKANFYANRLFEIFPYNKQHQLLLRHVLDVSLNNNQLSQNDYDHQIKILNDKISKNNNNINSLYKYINFQMDY